ncbi:MAG: hypothetical protein ACYDG2_14125 [Ruminiclostridium sp.]
MDFSWLTGGWHTGISAGGSNVSKTNFYQARGSGETTSYDNFQKFMNYPKVKTNTFQGYYYVSGMDSYYKTDILSTADTLADNALPYCLLDPLGTDNSDNSAYISPSEITAARCDGFLEYCYEWNNVKITGYSWGDEEVWDISQYDPGLFAHSYIYIPGMFGSYTLQHSSTLLTPADQADNMTYAGGYGTAP